MPYPIDIDSVRMVFLLIAHSRVSPLSALLPRSGRTSATDNARAPLGRVGLEPTTTQLEGLIVVSTVHPFKNRNRFGLSSDGFRWEQHRPDQQISPRTPNCITATQAYFMSLFDCLAYSNIHN